MHNYFNCFSDNEFVSHRVFTVHAVFVSPFIVSQSFVTV